MIRNYRATLRLETVIQVMAMTESEKNKAEYTGMKQESCSEEQMQTDENRYVEGTRESSAKFRKASYFVLFIAAVFVVNAMETGSYRTPWPVAILTTLAGLGLFGYSWYLKFRSSD